MNAVEQDNTAGSLDNRAVHKNATQQMKGQGDI